jgi:CRP/FNR family cyclic AMP-dependent transcriptional regulator
MIIDKTQLFQGLEEGFVKQVSEALEEQLFEQGSYVFHEGDAADSLYILAQGKVRLMVGDLGSVAQTVRNAGDVFGWSSLLGPAGYTATAQCLSPTRVMVISGDRLNHLLENQPAVGLVFFRRVAALVRKRLIDSYRILMTYHSLKKPQSYG